ncbi:MAG: FtsX-like permease family protein [Proteobacteria bacterium]|nr:FtsX-like permease family protein [Pseudomonadota bacterium]
MSLFWFSLRMLRRDWRAGELRVLFVALLIAVASVSAVGFSADRVDRALHRQANELLGADALVVADHPLASGLLQRAHAAGLKSAKTLSFASMALAGDRNQLAEVKAVSEGYPLRGELRIAQEPFAPEQQVQTIPPPGTVWADARLLSQLALKVGDVITLGAAQLRVAAVLTHEPDRGGDLFSIGPRLLMNLHDVPATQLIQTGSRIRYRLLVAGDAQQVQNFRAAVTPLGPGEKLEGVEDARPEVRAALERAKRFLGLAALVSVLLAAVACAMSARRFTARHLDSCAIMRCLGARQSVITRIYLYQMLILGLIASLAGCAAGYAAQGVLTGLLGQLVAVQLPPPSLAPVLTGVATGLLTLLGFVVPPVLALKGVPTLRVLRREIGLPARGVSAYLFGAALFILLMLWQAGEVKLGLTLVASTAATLALLAAAAFALVRALTLMRGRVGVAWRFGLANIVRRASGSVAQILAIGLGLTALLLLTLVRGDLLASWQGSLPQDAPNRFVINIQPEQLGALRDFFARENMPPPDVYPMVRGRLVAVNGKSVAPASYADEGAARMIEREFNLSWMAQLPGDNRISAGRWWGDGASGEHALSVEEGIAKTLGIVLNDRLTYNVAGQEFTGVVTSLRKVEWDSFRVNFFVIAAPGTLEQYPASYITSFYLPDDRQPLLSALVKSFPNLTIIDVAAIMTQVRGIIERVTLAVEYIFIFTLAAGVMVLYAAIQSAQHERLHDGAMLRTLGASRWQLLSGVAAEFVVLGFLAGLVAAFAASATGYVLAERLFHLPYHFNPWLWLIGPGLGAVGVGVAGLLGSVPVLRHPPLHTLREV